MLTRLAVSDISMRPEDRLDIINFQEAGRRAAARGVEQKVDKPESRQKAAT